MSSQGYPPPGQGPPQGWGQPQQAQPQQPGWGQQQQQPGWGQQQQQGWAQPTQGQGHYGQPQPGPYGQQGQAQYGMAPHAGSAMHGPMTPEARQYAMLIHLAQLAGYVVPFAGLVLPILLWQAKKDDLPGIDAHGKAVANWIISEVIYAVVGGILMFFFVGIFLLLLLAFCSIVFSIIGAVKANNGELWHYPLAIKFLK